MNTEDTAPVASLRLSSDARLSVRRFFAADSPATEVSHAHLAASRIRVPLPWATERNKQFPSPPTGNTPASRTSHFSPLMAGQLSAVLPCSDHAKQTSFKFAAIILGKSRHPGRHMASGCKQHRASVTLPPDRLHSAQGPNLSLRLHWWQRQQVRPVMYEV